MLGSADAITSCAICAVRHTKLESKARWTPQIHSRNALKNDGLKDRLGVGLGQFVSLTGNFYQASPQAEQALLFTTGSEPAYPKTSLVDRSLVKSPEQLHRILNAKRGKRFDARTNIWKCECESGKTSGAGLQANCGGRPIP